MRSFNLAAVAMATTLFAAPAMAQTAPGQTSPGAPGQTMPGQADPAAPTGAAPQSAPPAAAASGPVSDAEVTQFANALTAVDKINKDTATPAADKQTQMAQAVTSAGLTPERFNSIATAMSSDTALQAKVAAAMPPAAPAGGAAPQQ
ncbi:DUF4168 domain-containing protein [Sphingomonas sp.]|uniref:DUF4168 domain-containing protein n=1 Tax=Sphingomonas sp. TaxID=28214 RepID=UPI002C2538C0|nr:DUF4168 domain-containing protein [Sphingomonas sp.]HTG37900.1 DUF4168 domain-containing protein [Sphingomonas sp.]